MSTTTASTKSPAGDVGLFGVGLYLRCALSESDEPRLGGLGEVPLLVLPGDFGLHGVQQQPEVLGLDLEVFEVGGELGVVYVAPGLKPDVAILLGFLLAEPPAEVLAALE